MQLSDFRIGLEFWSGDRQWRCTDVGSRVAVAIRVDQAEIATLADGVTTTRTADRAEAEAIGWFDGPPYAVAEHIFDEDSIEGCSIERDG